MMIRKFTLLFVGLWLLSMHNAFATSSFKFEKVADKTYAYIGPLTDRTPENLGLNDNIGLVLTSKGAVLIDSGAGNPSAKALEEAAKVITPLPIVAVINSGSQDHRWLGNHYFAQKGATIYALAQTVATQKTHAADQIAHMSQVSSEFIGTQPTYAAKPFVGDEAVFKVGDTEFQLKFLGNAHFPGDAVVWLPKQQVLFSGDLIYVDRMLGVFSYSNVKTWQQAFHRAETLPAKVIVPGHGQVCDWAKAKQDSGDYLDKLVKVISVAAENMVGIDQVVTDNQDWPEFKHLQQYDAWHKTILNRTYLQFEQGM